MTEDSQRRATIRPHVEEEVLEISCTLPDFIEVIEIRIPITDLMRYQHFCE